jgi:hypothetical protein
MPMIFDIGCVEIDGQKKVKNPTRLPNMGADSPLGALLEHGSFLTTTKSPPLWLPVPNMTQKQAQEFVDSVNKELDSKTKFLEENWKPKGNSPAEIKKGMEAKKQGVKWFCDGAAAQTYRKCLSGMVDKKFKYGPQEDVEKSNFTPYGDGKDRDVCDFLEKQKQIKDPKEQFWYCFHPLKRSSIACRVGNVLIRKVILKYGPEAGVTAMEFYTFREDHGKMTMDVETVRDSAIESAILRRKRTSGDDGISAQMGIVHAPIILRNQHVKLAENPATGAKTDVSAATLGMTDDELAEMLKNNGLE